MSAQGDQVVEVSNPATIQKEFETYLDSLHVVGFQGEENMDLMNGSVEDIYNQAIQGFTEPKNILWLVNDRNYTKQMIATKISSPESFKRYSKLILLLNLYKLTEADVPDYSASIVAILRATLTCQNLIPLEFSDVKPCKLEIRYASITEFREMMTIRVPILDLGDRYTSIDHVVTEYPYMVFFAWYFRLTKIHLVQSSHEKMFVKIKKIIHQTLAGDQCVKFDLSELRLVMHCFGFKHLNSALSKVKDYLPNPLIVRTQSAGTGCALIPTTYAVLFTMQYQPSLIEANKVISKLMPLLQRCSNSIRNNPTLYVGHATMYGHEKQTYVQVEQVCKELSPLCLGYLQVYLPGSQISKQKVLTKHCEEKGELLQQWVTIFEGFKNEVLPALSGMDTLGQLITSMLTNLSSYETIGSDPSYQIRIDNNGKIVV